MFYLEYLPGKNSKSRNKDEDNNDRNSSPLSLSITDLTAKNDSEMECRVFVWMMFSLFRTLSIQACVSSGNRVLDDGNLLRITPSLLLRSVDDDA